VKLFLAGYPDLPPAIVTSIDDPHADIVFGMGIEQSLKGAFLNDLMQCDALAFRPTGHISPQAAFELGVAAARSIPILILADRPHDPLPITEPTIQIFDTIDSFQFALTQIRRSFAAAEIAKGKSEQPLPSRRQREGAQRFIEFLHREHGRLTSDSFEEALLDLLRSTGTETLATGYDQRAFDFAIWDSRLEKAIGNPILIEAKITARLEVIEQFAQKLAAIGPMYRDAAALLIWFDGPPPQFPQKNAGAIQAYELAELLLKQALPSVLQGIFKGPGAV
jgi:hypothetical protein